MRINEQRVSSSGNTGAVQKKKETNPAFVMSQVMDKIGDLAEVTAKPITTDHLYQLLRSVSQSAELRNSDLGLQVLTQSPIQLFVSHEMFSDYAAERALICNIADGLMRREDFTERGEQIGRLKRFSKKSYKGRVAEMVAHKVEVMRSNEDAMIRVGLLKEEERRSDEEYYQQAVEEVITESAPKRHLPVVNQAAVREQRLLEDATATVMNRIDNNDWNTMLLT